LIANAVAKVSPAHSHAHRLAPLTHPRVADAVDGLVGPFHGRGGEGLGVDVAGRGVEGERDEAFVVAAVDLEFADVEEGAEAAPIPIDADLHAPGRRIIRRFRGLAQINLR
jgi:hypothetical protein